MRLCCLAATGIGDVQRLVAKYDESMHAAVLCCDVSVASEGGMGVMEWMAMLGWKL